MKKGFTLVELLAVIVILGVLLLIAVPAVSNLIENSRKNAFVADAKTYIQAAKYMNATEQDSDFIMYSIGDTTSELKSLDDEIDGTGNSPYGFKYSGYVAAIKQESSIKYSIYLRDGKTDGSKICHSIGFTASSVDNFYLENAIDSSSVIEANCDDIEENNNYESYFTQEQTEIEEEEGGGEKEQPSFAINFIKGNDETESVSLSKDEYGKIVIENLLEKGSMVFLNVCPDIDHRDIEKKATWEECFIPFSVLLETDKELYLYERPRNDKDRNYSFTNIKSTTAPKIYKAKEIYENVMGPLNFSQFRLLTIEDIKASLNNNMLSRENLVQFGRVFHPFDWHWFSEKNQPVRYGVCGDTGGMISGDICIWNPKGYERISEDTLRTYARLYWIAGSSDELNGFDSDVSYDFFAEADGYYKGSKVPAINLNEQFILTQVSPGFTWEWAKTYDYQENKYSQTQTKKFAYAYYVLNNEKSKFNNLLYCMKDTYDGFELCEEFKTND